MNMARYGIYGSAFDPITYAHLWTAWTVAVRRNLDKVIFVPSSDYRGDKGRKLTAGKHRWNLLQLAVADNPKFEASDIELKAEAWEQYTHDTMEHFKRMYPHDEVFFIMGADNLANISSWSKGEELIRENKFIVMAREGYNMLEIIAKDPMLRNYELDHFDLLHKGLNMEISSSYIRDEFSVGGDPRYLMPDVCYEYAKKHNVYVKR
ncbi:nicotinate-nucleotide adenylyltransferase [Aneurinibacillus migulanus]|uniref:nicotinate-nucleotide adenylyltransferase n=2 Tax=Aneurinibacillus migulanus TaxID=47500 RepID=UPI002E0F52A3|nr:nicotinate-nucleotide adenylyltransferase [Aneurinibacillus migulanus]